MGADRMFKDACRDCWQSLGRSETEGVELMASTLKTKAGALARIKCAGNTLENQWRRSPSRTLEIVEDVDRPAIISGAVWMALYLLARTSGANLKTRSTCWQRCTPWQHDNAWCRIRTR